MKAAVVTRFDAPPTAREFPEPVPEGPDEVLIDVLAAGLHPRVRSQANGSHYTSTDELPLVPGIDGVGRLPDGSLRYFVLPDTRMGSMAERTVIDPRRSVELTHPVDANTLAAGMNPGMSSWVALRRRIDFPPGQTVVVLGATGNAGRMAVQIAKHLGAGRVIGVGRGEQRLEALAALGADAVVSLEGDPAAVAQRVAATAGETDVVIDYLWGRPALDTMVALARARRERARRLSWIQIGSVAGRSIELPSELLRAANLQIMGSGQGSVTTAGILAELPLLAMELTRGTLTVRPRPVALGDVEAAWSQPAGDDRIVIVPPS
jgi:NADPH:quinone reductase-like Zn-dependent oxidoreductase